MFVIRIGTGNNQTFFKADDQPPVKNKKQALRFLDRAAAEREAAAVRETWNLKPAKGATPAVLVVTA